MDFYKRALELNDETIAHRRFFHKNAETGLNMPIAVEYVMKKLSEFGLNPQKCGYGVTALLGKGEKTLLLRADMDALPMPEESGEEFACPTGKQAHACGHDFHAAMLLTAAKILKENENKLCGKVKLMFQPAEETFEGSKNMIENGILENPKPDAALAFHVAPGKLPIGLFMYNCGGVMMSSVDGFRITITGKGGHGAYPNLTVDPIHTAVQIYTALEGLIARNSNSEKNCVLTVGKFQSGNAANIIPDTAVLEGTLRTNDTHERELLVGKIREVANGISEINGAKAEITPLSEVPPLICDSKFTEQIAGFMQEMNIPGITPYPNMQANASEDFAVIAEKIPSAFIYLSAGFPDERGAYSAHNPKVHFNEEVCPIGASALAHCAVRWLETNK
ncbi:M20 family metallopeptidase [Ruminococcus sp.]|uniref:M20 family metallopeptidase n=1 Tax=Ruminococcus sp. TaxID=41978 RepID=UPI003EFBCEF6